MLYGSHVFGDPYFFYEEIVVVDGLVGEVVVERW